jgi:hypothetical protein
MLVGLKFNEVLPVIQTEETKNNTKKKKWFHINQEKANRKECKSLHCWTRILRNSQRKIGRVHQDQIL